MLHKFLEIQVDRNGDIIKDKEESLSYKLFAGGKIELGFGEEKIINKLKIRDSEYAMRRQGQYSIIFVDLKDSIGNNFDDIRSRLFHTLTTIINKFSYRKDYIETYEEITIGEKFNTLLSAVQNGNSNSIIKDLCGLLYAYNHRKRMAQIGWSQEENLNLRGEKKKRTKEQKKKKAVTPSVVSICISYLLIL